MTRVLLMNIVCFSDSGPLPLEKHSGKPRIRHVNDLVELNIVVSIKIVPNFGRQEVPFSP